MSLVKLEIRYHGHAATWEQADRALQGDFGKAIKGVTGEDIHILARHTPGGPTGPMARSYIADYSGDGLRVSSTVYNTKKYFWIVVSGRKAIDQKAMGRTKPLRFIIRGKVLFRWRVGPVAPNRFIDRAKVEIRKEHKKAAHKIAQEALPKSYGYSE